MSESWKGAAQPRELRDQDYEAAAERLGCDVPAIRAVWEVEAAGRHFLADGSVIRRFEPHHFPRELWAQIGFQPREGEAPWRAGLRLSSESMFQAATGFDMDAAIRASSWGAPQIMGFNCEDAGFDSPRAMVEHMARGAPEHLGAFVQLIEGWGIASALRGHDWAGFARRYNGSGQVAEYARRMEAAYRRHSGGQRSPVVLRVGARGAAVRELQRALGIEDDGAFGPETLEAVRRFQERAGIAVDGVVGHRTWEALRSADERVAPPVQETPADSRSDLVAQITGATAALTAIAGAAGQLRESFPPAMYEMLIWGAFAMGAVYVGARVFRSVRRTVREA